MKSIVSFRFQEISTTFFTKIFDCFGYFSSNFEFNYQPQGFHDDLEILQQVINDIFPLFSPVQAMEQDMRDKLRLGMIIMKLEVMMVLKCLI